MIKNRYTATVMRGFAVGAAAFAVSAVGASGVEARDLVVANTTLTPALDPMAANSTPNERISNNLVEGLVEWDPHSATLKPMLAESWEVLDDQTIEFVLRQGVKCHDGQDFTAEDVAVSLGPKRFRGDVPGWGIARGFLGNIADVEVLDSHRLRLHSDIPDPLMLQRMGTWMSQMICKEAFLAASWEDWGKAVVGTGPYRIAELRTGEFIRLERFDGYWGDPAPADSVTFTAVPEMAARVSGLLTGEYDIISEVVPDQFASIEGSGVAEVAGGPVETIRVLLFDSNHPVLADPRVRQALSYAIDRELIVESIMHDRTEVPHSMQFEAYGDMFIGEHQSIGFDPDKARELLAAAGYAGEPISYRFRQDFYTAEVMTAQILQAMWRDVGLNIELEMHESAASIIGPNSGPGRGIFNLSNGGYWNDPVGMLWRLYQDGSLIPSYGIWNNAEFNELGEDLLSTDAERRRAAFARMLEIYEHDDPPGTFLHTHALFYGKRASLDWTAHTTAFMDLRAGNLSFVD